MPPIQNSILAAKSSQEQLMNALIRSWLLASILKRMQVIKLVLTVLPKIGFTRHPQRAGELQNDN